MHTITRLDVSLHRTQRPDVLVWRAACPPATFAQSGDATCNGKLTDKLNHTALCRAPLLHKPAPAPA